MRARTVKSRLRRAVRTIMGRRLYTAGAGDQALWCRDEVDIVDGVDDVDQAEDMYWSTPSTMSITSTSPTLAPSRMPSIASLPASLPTDRP